jgi:putative nucleotidyltransferase with HDIG domain
MARRFSDLPRSGQIFLATVICAGAVAIAHSSIALVRQPADWDWLILAALIIVTASFSIKVPSVNARLSVSEAFVIASVLSFGVHVGTVVVALDSLVLTTWLRRPTRSPLRAMFNMAAGALAISVAARVFEWILPIQPAASVPLERLLVPVFALALAYFAINSWLIATAVAYEQNAAPGRIWHRHFSWVALNYLGGASVALVLVSYAADINLTAVGVVVPLLIVLYLTFRTSWGRLEDANKHVAQLNELYLSTIETLAMAVDAKDQITHGHIRRVEVYAVELAKRLGATDDNQLRAIATAALLHDMGKLAIPEHILNKPGKLTPGEFDKMKRHADIGADLLSSVKFPFPVVPIVRHHHEHWNGTGYPAGIAATDIPLGARILSVVDCFDALTSDRPYRPRLSTNDAFKIIRDQAGTTYDPLVVEVFIKNYPEIAPLAIRAGQEARSVIDGSDLITSSDSHASAPLHQIRTNASEAALLDACSRDIAKATSPIAALDASAQSLRQVTPATVYALFEYDSSSDLLRCVATVGDTDKLLKGLAIKLGEKVTGWVAANRRTSVDSDASLDLMQIAAYFTPPLRSSISTPLTEADRLVGVLTAYTITEGAFHQSHRYAFEYVASVLAMRLASWPPGIVSNVVSFSRSKP